MIVQQSILFDKISTQFISFFNYALICFFLWNFYSHTSLQSATPTRLSINTSFRRLNNPVPVSLLSGDRKPQIRFLGNHPSGSGNLYHKSFRM